MIISSPNTFMYKRVVPLFLLGIIAVFSGSMLLKASHFDVMPKWASVLPLIIMVVLLIFYKISILPMMDNVADRGTYLEVTFGPRTDRIDFANIEECAYVAFRNPPIIRLKLKSHSVLGPQITFIPVDPEMGMFAGFRRRNSVADSIQKRMLRKV